MSEIKHINQEEFENTIKNNKLVLIDFFATWCPPCKMIGPVLEELQDLIKDVLIVKMDVDLNEDLAKQFKIMNIPTLMLFKNGELVQKEIGVKDLAYLIDMVKTQLD
jgi:thioredoxin 1